MDKNERNSSFELLRIVSMLFIIIGHIILYGGFFKNSSPTLFPIVMLLEIFIIIHVNSYILVTGYFQSQSKLNFKKVVNLFLTVWFYRILVLLGIFIFLAIKSNGINFLEFLKINLYNYWFINVYIVLYILSPFLNIIIEKLNKKGYLILLCSMFVFCSVFTCCIYPAFFANNGGYSLVNFVLLYFIGGYIRKFSLDDYKLLKSKTRKQKIFFFLLLYIAITLLNFGMFIIGNYILLPINTSLGEKIKSIVLHYDNPLVVLASISYFMMFYYTEIKSKIINFIAKFNFDVYLVHENAPIKHYIYVLLGFDLLKYSSFSWIGKILLASLIIFLCSSIIGMARYYFFKIMGKLKFVKKISKKLDILNKKYYEYIGGDAYE